MSNLPSDPRELRDLLVQALRGFDAAIEEARQQAERRRRAEERWAVLEEFAGSIASRAATLRELGERAPAAAAEELAAEIARDLADLRACLEAPSAEPPGAPAPEAAEPPEPCVATAAREAALVQAEVAAIRERTTELDLAVFSRLLDDDEIEARLALLALHARALQERHPSAMDEGTAPGRALHEAFGAMSRLAREALAPAGKFLPYLKRSHRADWEAETMRWRMRLAELLRAREERATRATDMRRHEAARAELARVRDQILEELRQIVAGCESDPLWQFDFLDVLREAMATGDGVDDELLDFVVPHASLLAKGEEFRRLRRQLKRRERPGGAPAPAAAEPDLLAPEPITPHPFERYRGAFAARDAAIVGGSSREHRRIALQRFLGFRRLEWIENERTETADGASLAQRIENGAFDCVFLLADFCSHALQDPVKDACKRCGVPFILVRHGYGIVAFGRALDDAGRLVAQAG